MPSPAAVVDSAIPVPPPGVAAIFLGFLSVSLLGFGGVLPWARWILVERRRWLTPDEFTETLALCQFMPGPNIVNLSVAVGARFQGIFGGAAALLGIIGAPFVIVVTLGLLYEHFGDLPLLHNVLTGVAAAASGLIIATVAKIGRPLFRRGAYVQPLLAVAGFAAVGLLRFPLPYVMLALAPISIAWAWWRIR
jgi:chromate transporter